MNVNLFKAILAMDSYNRGYGAGIKFGNLADGVSEDTPSTKIGNATISANSTLAFGAGVAESIGFYGIAYQLPSGEKVISYRGTDQVPTILDPFTPDLLNGYGVGAGSPAGKQAELAIKFYQTVAGAEANWRSANISLTGHSLGGGLAGLVGGLYNRSGVLFNNMAYQKAASNGYLYSTDHIEVRINPVSGLPESTTVPANVALKTLIYGSTTSPVAASFLNLNTIYMKEEFLTLNRLSQTGGKIEVNVGPDVLGLSGTQLHSMATMVMQLYANTTVTDHSWEKAAKYFWPVMYDGNFAKDIGMYKVPGQLATDAVAGGSKVDKYAEILRTILAYSAIDEGTRVFGDTGIRAFYNDANDLGKALAVAGGSTALAARASDVSKAFIQFAGQLALNKISLTAALTPVLDGVLTYTNAFQNHSLTVDFTSPVWSRSGPAAIYPAYTLVNSLIGSAATTPVTRTVMKTLWGDDTSAAFDKIVFSALESGTLQVSGTPATGKAFLLVGGNGADVLSGSEGRDLFLGTGGNDTLYGKGGNDIFISGAGSDTLYGGAGYDAAVYRGEISGVTISNNIVTKGSGVDTLSDVEHMVLTNLDDTVTVKGTELLKYWDGGAGRDIFNAAGVYAYDMKGGRLFNNVGSETVLKNFEEVRLTTNYIYPDETRNLTYNYATSELVGGTEKVFLISGAGGSHIIDYGGASQAAVFRLTNVPILSETNNVVTIGGKTHTYERGGNFVGTNRGDIVDISAVRNIFDPRQPTMKFVSGTGNDVVNVGAEGVEYVYTGGNDVVRGVLTTLTLGPSIAYTDITSFSLGGLSGRSLSMTIKGHGTLEVQDMGGGNGFRVYFDSTGSRIDEYGQLVVPRYAFVPAGLEKKGSIANDSLTAVPDRAQNLDGLAGNDTLVGNDFVNTILGGSGDDILRGGKGNDSLDGGDGNDSYYYDLGDGNDVITDEYGSDKIVLGAGISKSQVTFFSSYLPSPTGQFYIRVGATDKIEIQGGGVEKLVFADGSVVDLTGGLPFTGTDMDEKIKGTSYNDTLTGRKGIDELSGGDGNDVYFFNLGDSPWYERFFTSEKIIDTAGTDTIEFGAGITQASVWFERGYDFDKRSFSFIFVHYSSTDALCIADTVKCISESISSSSSSDVYTSKIEKIKFSDGSIMDISSGVPLSGTPLGNYILGLAGNDTINGGMGDDQLEGGPGNDTYKFAIGDGVDVVVEGTGTDTLLMGTGITAANIRFEKLGNDLNIYYGASDKIMVQNQFYDDNYASSSYDEIETLKFADGTSINLKGGLTFTGTTAAEYVLGTNQSDSLLGLAGDDYLLAYGGNDTLNGGSGNDYLDGGAGVDMASYAGAAAAVTVTLALTTAQNTIGAGTDTLMGIENLLGSSYNDILTGNAGVNTIEGGLGNDTLNGGAGTDTVSYSTAPSGVTVDLSLTTAQNTVGAGSDLLSNFENIFGSAFGDTLKGNAGANVITAGSGNDTLNGGSGADVLYGGIGADVFKFDASAVGTIDTVKDFKLSESDKLNIHDLLVGYDPLTKAITDFIECTTSGANTIVKVDRDGTGSTYAWQQVAVFEAVTGLTDEAALKADGTLIA